MSLPVSARWTYLIKTIAYNIPAVRSGEKEHHGEDLDGCSFPVQY